MASMSTPSFSNPCNSKETVPRPLARPLVRCRTRNEAVVDHSMAKGAKVPTCGRLLAHCKEKVTAFREHQGIRLCVFKICVTADPVSRFQLYSDQGFTSMWLLATSDSVDLIHMLEAALISEFCKHVGCRNREGTGGEGALNRKATINPPYYVYVTGGRADQPRRVG